MKKYFQIKEMNYRKDIECLRILEEILPYNEISKRRNIKVYTEWVLEKDQLLNEKAAQNEKFKLFMRPYRHPIAKKFYEEIKPLAAFLEMQNLFKNMDIVQLSSNNADYDAQILNDNGTIFYIEITVIYKDEQDVLGEFILNKRGYHFLGSKIEKVNHNILACDDSCASSFNSILYETTQRIKEAIERKNKINYPKRTLLIVGGICNGQYYEEDLKQIRDVLKETPSNKFAGVFFVDLNKKVFCDNYAVK